MGLAWTLFLIFLILKLCGLITWSWWWILAPLWASYSLQFILYIVTKD